MRAIPTYAVLTLVLGVVLVGLALAALMDWQVGAFVIGGGLLLAAGLRLTLRERQAGLLVVRGRVTDAAVLLTLGFAMVALANTIPRG